MATVYLARDVRHQRNVALKLLSPELGAVVGAERFLSEIQVTANLQHPNLLPLFDSGEAEGLLFYVMPFVAGESLRKRLGREKQLPVAETVRMATAIAEALDYAHRHGVIHRDLKPENILLHEGQPLIADFGIALAVSRAGGERVTQTGISLGTPHYMSPEQATGDRQIDGRTDIYSLGAVVYECLTGDPPHTASTAQAVIAKVLTDRVTSVRLLRPSVPEHVDAAVMRALEKLPADRFSTAHDFAEALHGNAVAIPGDVVTPGSVRSPNVRALRIRSRAMRWLPWAVAAVATGVAATALVSRQRDLDAQRVVRFMLQLRPNDRLAIGQTGRHFAISPDGSTIAYVAISAGNSPRLVLRAMGEAIGREVPGSDGANEPFFSPDGRWVGFLANEQLKKVAIDGGAVVPLGTTGGLVTGAAWAGSDRIILPVAGGFDAVDVNGGGERVHLLSSPVAAQPVRWPLVLPDGKTVLYTRWGGSIASAHIGVASLATGEMHDLGVQGSSPIGVLDGYLIYAGLNDGLYAVAFDARRLRVTGQPMLVVDKVYVSVTGGAMAALSPTGTLVYQIGSAALALVLGDSAGNLRQLLPEARPFGHPRFSPDGKRIALELSVGGSTDIHIYSLEAGTLTRLTTEGSTNDRAEWTWDGKRVLYRSERPEGVGLWWQSADFGGVAQVLQPARPGGVWEGNPSPDGRTLLYRTGTVQTSDLWYRSLTGDTTSTALLKTQFTEWAARFSPDGKWIAYQSDQSRRFEVYVMPFPGPGERVQVSDNGGEVPIWSRDGKRLFYVNNQRIVAADLVTSPEFRVTRRHDVFTADFVDLPGHPNYDVAPDGKHFLMLRPTVSGDQVMVVDNWRAELRRKVVR
jgi:serine/threonine-protein kinase